MVAEGRDGKHAKDAKDAKEPLLKGSKGTGSRAGGVGKAS